MKIKSCKLQQDMVYVTLVVSTLALLTVAGVAQGDDHNDSSVEVEERSNLTKSDDNIIRNSNITGIPLAHGFKPSRIGDTVVSTSSPIVHVHDQDKQKESILHGAGGKVNQEAEAGLELRSNSSSSFESLQSHGVQSPSKHSLFTDHFSVDAGKEENASGTAAVVRGQNPHNHDHEDAHIHEHIERYQIHQGSEEDDSVEEHQPRYQPGLNHPSSNPSISAVVHPISEKNPNPNSNVASESVAVSTDSFPVRLGPNNSRQSASKPIPILRQENAAAGNAHF